MEGLSGMFAEVFEELNKGKLNPEDYQENGLWYCGKCRTPKQCRIEFLGVPRTPFCTCRCEEEEDRRIKQELERQKIERCRHHCFQEYSLESCRFSTDDGRGNRKAMQAARRYAERFEELTGKCVGLLFSGTVGTGKTFAAACIANELIDRGHSCYMTNFSGIIDGKWDATQKAEFMENLIRYELLIIDDFGTEYRSDYTEGIIMQVIDGRYRNKKPMVITTNMTAGELTDPKNNRMNKRINSRLFEQMLIIDYSGADRRQEILKKHQAEARNLLGLE